MAIAQNRYSQHEIMEAGMNKTKSRPVYEIEVNDVWYIYTMGLTHMAISIKPDPDVWPLLPDHFKVCFMVETPDLANEERLLGGCSEVVKAAAVKAIRAKIAEQKKSGDFPRHLPTPQPKKSKAKTKKEIER
jgi:hypothetical protein